MSTGAFAVEPTGAFLPDPFGARRLAWMTTTHARPLFAVFYIDEADNGYPSTSVGRSRWNNDVAEYELLAAEMTEQDLWRELVMLLVHVEDSARPRRILPIVPTGVSTYPSRINGPDDVTMPRKRPPPEENSCNFDVFRFTLEHGHSPVLPRVVYIDESGSMTADSIRPGWTEWVDSSPVPIDIHLVDAGAAEPSEQWVTWLSDVVRGILEEFGR